jgi:hypothetical protein
LPSINRWARPLSIGSDAAAESRDEPGCGSLAAETRGQSGGGMRECFFDDRTSRHPLGSTRPSSIGGWSAQEATQRRTIARSSGRQAKGSGGGEGSPSLRILERSGTGQEASRPSLLLLLFPRHSNGVGPNHTHPHAGLAAGRWPLAARLATDSEKRRGGRGRNAPSHCNGASLERKAQWR